MPFHLAIAVHDLEAARAFYGEVLGLPSGRSADNWIDFDLFGHQLVMHLDKGFRDKRRACHSSVDGHDVPVPHFGVILEWDQFQAFSEQLMNAGVEFVISPSVRFAGQVGEQATMFFKDPSGNALEFKAFRDLDQLFAGGQ